MASKANGPEKRTQRDGKTQTSSAASAIELLEADHREVEALFEQYEELDDRANRLGAVLRDAGVGPDDKVAIMCVNAPEYVETFFAAHLKPQ